MKIKDQVCSLELAKRLKQLGVKQDGIFAWWDIPKEFPCQDVVKGADVYSNNFSPFYSGTRKRVKEKYGAQVDLFRYQALTVVELGVILPALIPMENHKNHNGRLTLWKINDNWQLAYNLESKQCHEISTHDNNMPNAYAEMLINLIEKGIVKP